MSTDRIQELHEQASECYLSGDYRGALEAWRGVLGLDPANEQALGGVRLAAQFVEQAPPAFAEAASELEQELDQGLRVLDGLGTTGLLQQSDVPDGSIDCKPEPASHGPTSAAESLEGWDMPEAPSGDDGSFGLEPVSETSPEPGSIPPASAASMELERRVNDLLAEAKAKAAAGERDEALSILARLSILDEDNAEAHALRSEIDAAAASDLDQVERAIIEGVAALEADRFDDAERYFRDALALAPSHLEAQHYLEQAEERRASAGEDLLAAPEGESAPAEDAVERAIGIEDSPRKPLRAASSQRFDSIEPVPSASGPRFALPAPRTLIFGGVAALALVCGAIALPRLLGDSGPKDPGPVVRPPRAARPGGAPRAIAGAPAPVVPNVPEDREKSIASSLAKAQSLVASGDYGGAVLAFNEALTLDPGNLKAKNGIAEAGERYKATKSEREAINNIKLAFRDGEFTSGLRLAYRLPPTVDKAYVDAIKVVGWYDLAVVALRAGDCREAQAHLGEALEIDPTDAEAKKLREFAARYVEAVKDRTFLSRVEALEFRTLPSS